MATRPTRLQLLDTGYTAYTLHHEDTIKLIFRGKIEFDSLSLRGGASNILYIMRMRLTVKIQFGLVKFMLGSM